MVQNGKIAESTAGLNGIEMWNCALENFNTNTCNARLSALVGDKSDISILATNCVNKLTTVPAVGNIGVLVMLNRFSDCSFIKSDPFEIISTQNISFNDPLITSFFIRTNYYENNSDVNFIENETNLLDLKCGLKAIEFNVINSSFNKIYAVYESQEDDFMWFNLNHTTDNEIEILSPIREPILSIIKVINENGDVKPKKTIFNKCMNAVQDEMEDSWDSWIAWNSLPTVVNVVQLYTVARCQACAKAGRAWQQICPKAYIDNWNNY